MTFDRAIFATVAALLAFGPAPAMAYIGPGAGLGAIAVTIALLLGALLLFVGLVWYPLKRMLKNRKADKTQADTASGSE